MTTALEGGEGSASRPVLSLPPGKDPAPNVQEAGWAPGSVSTGAENLAPTEILSPDRPARRQSLYRLPYPARSHEWMVCEWYESRFLWGSNCIWNFKILIKNLYWFEILNFIYVLVLCFLPPGNAFWNLVTSQSRFPSKNTCFRSLKDISPEMCLCNLIKDICRDMENI